jgi:hypothetical protein
MAGWMEEMKGEGDKRRRRTMEAIGRFRREKRASWRGKEGGG